jgi:hypothetical protein
MLVMEAGPNAKGRYRTKWTSANVFHSVSSAIEYGEDQNTKREEQMERFKTLCNGDAAGIKLDGELIQALAAEYTAGGAGAGEAQTMLAKILNGAGQFTDQAIWDGAGGGRTSSGGGDHWAAEREALLAFAQALGTAAAAAPLADQDSTATHFVPTKLRFSAPKYELGTKIRYRIRTQVADMDPTRSRADSAAERALRQTRQDDSDWTVALSWSEIYKLHQYIQKKVWSDRAFKLPMPALPDFPATRSWNGFETTKEVRLASLVEYCGKLGEWDEAMFKKDGFRLVGVCGVRAILDEKSKPAAAEGSRK